MNQISLITELIYKRQQQEVLNEVAGYQVVRDALQIKKHDGLARSKFLVKLGMLLQSVGHTLENRYGGHFDGTSQPIEDCSQGNYA